MDLNMKDEVRMPDILPPVAWGGVLPSGSFRQQTPVRITLLHSEEFIFPNSRIFSHVKSTQTRDIQKGWGDLGCHYYIDPMGGIYQSRRVVIKGRIDEEKEFNVDGHVFVMLLGDYNKNYTIGDEFFLLQDLFKEQLIALLAWLSHHHKIPLEEIKGLNGFVDTDSPGRLFIEWFESPEYEIRIKEHMGIPFPKPIPEIQETSLQSG